MSRKAQSATRKNPSPAKPRKPDARARRTCERLGGALITLIQEKPVAEVTIQEVLDRADVGRSTFYLHYRGKDDLLLSQLEGFLDLMSTMLSKRKDRSPRLVPVAEMFDHIGHQNKLLRTISDAGFLPDFYDLAQGYFERGIARRLLESKRLPDCSTAELELRATAIAGSLLSLLRWWMDRGQQVSPQQMDDLFHRMAWSGLNIPTGQNTDRLLAGQALRSATK
jgi:AcrR family transcriptional regulator